MNAQKRHRRTSRGQTLIETALVLPIMFLFIFYAIITVLFGYDTVQISNLSQRTSIDIAQNGAESSPIDQRIIIAAKYANLDPTRLQVCVDIQNAQGVDQTTPANLCHPASNTTSPSPGQPGVGGTVIVQLGYTFFVPFPGGTRTIPITTTSEETALSYEPGHN